ncbi:MAG: hypothetical protein HYX68_07250 [Planctomycetes bacterium]|jgi:hypothetical protein|nr:hypothetical protein [Planctomycetota bacterium]
MKNCIASLIAVVALGFVAISADAGRIPGPGVNTTICQAKGSVTYFETFRGNELARIAIVGDGSTDLDVFVYDLQGRLIVQGIGLTDREVVSWFPGRTQTYRIVVKNLGNTWNRFSMASN